MHVCMAVFYGIFLQIRNWLQRTEDLCQHLTDLTQERCGDMRLVFCWQRSPILDDRNSDSRLAILCVMCCVEFWQNFFTNGFRRIVWRNMVTEIATFRMSIHFIQFCTCGNTHGLSAPYLFDRDVPYKYVWVGTTQMTHTYLSVRCTSVWCTSVRCTF